MIFNESNPLDSLKNLLQGFELQTAEKGDALVFKPHTVEDFSILFHSLTGEAIEDYLPATFTTVAKGLLLTGLPAIQQEDETHGLSLIKTEAGAYQLDFVVVWATPINLYDTVFIDAPYIVFNVAYAPGEGSALRVTGLLHSGKIKFQDYELALTVDVQVPSFLLDARLQIDAETTSSNPANDYLGDLKKKEATDITIEDIRFRAAPFLKNFSLYLSLANVLNIHDKFRINQFQAEINYQGSTDKKAYSILAYTDLEIGFEDSPLVISLSAAMETEGSVRKWKFAGAQDHPITVDQILQNLANLFQEGGAPAENPYQLPELIAGITLNYVGLAFEVVTGGLQTEQDYTFTLGLGIPVGEKEAKLEMYAHYQKIGSSYELELTGAIFLEGFQLAVGFAKKGDAGRSSTLMLGSLQTPLKLDSQYLIRALSPSLAAIVPIEVEVEIPGLLMALHQQKKGNETEPKEYLFRLSFNLDFGLDGFPLIGQWLKDLKFSDGQLLAANKDWQTKDLDDLNNLIGLIKPEAPKAIAKPQEANSNVGVGKGISLSGTLRLTEDLGFPLFLNFGGGEPASDKTEDTTEEVSASEETSNDLLSPAVSKPAAPSKKPASSAKPDERSQSKVAKVISAINIKKVGLVFQDGRLGLKITGGLSLAVLEFELIGLQITVPQKVLNDPTQLSELQFDLDGFGASIQKGSLSIMGAFLRMHYPAEKDHEAYDEYNGVIQVALIKFSLTGIGSYAKYDGHPSLFLFVALGFPIPVHPSLLIEGMALGFGIHRDAVAPKLEDILTYPLIQLSVTPPPPLVISDLVEQMHHYFPPTTDQYFVVAGIKFKAFGLVDTLAMLLVKFGRSFEINLIGVSSVYLPSVFIELAWMARFVPEEGYLFVGGQLTQRSYLFIPQVQLTGGFAVAAWVSNEHAGDFVASMGGYHPKFKAPAHYPDHIPRLGISFSLDPITIKGGVYFAITPKCLMMGGFMEASLEKELPLASVSASIKIFMDAFIHFLPFHYDVLIGVDAEVKVTIGCGFLADHIDGHFHFDMHIWGPDFSGTASIDVGPKTFNIDFGGASEQKALPISWGAFKMKFLHTAEDESFILTDDLFNELEGDLKDKLQKKLDDSGSKLQLNAECKGKSSFVLALDGLEESEIAELMDDSLLDKTSYEASKVCTATVTKGLIQKVKKDNKETHVVDFKWVEIEVKSLIPLESAMIGISPMDIKGGINATLNLGKHPFLPADLTDAVPKGIWGNEGLQLSNASSGDEMLLREVKTGVTLRTPPNTAMAASHEIDKDQLAYNKDLFHLQDPALALRMSGEKRSNSFITPIGDFAAFTGLQESDLVAVDAKNLRNQELVECSFE